MLWSAFGNAKDVPAETSIERSSSIILDWIATCRNTHAACTVKGIEETELPTRILDITPRQDASVVLIETRNTTCTEAYYATLSHCWGNAHFIKTTKQTLAQRKNGIGWDALPKTFQDAITILRALHIRFLWIDSLCIVQDDKLDWMRESRCMATIYSKGFLNVAATGASDSRGGCLFRRSLMHLGVESYPVDSTSSVGTVFVRPSFDLIHHRYSTHINHEMDSSDTNIVPLLSRAWVFQERHLAPRTLHFHPTEMIMECKSGLFCECTGLNKVATSMKNSLDVNSSENTGSADFDDWFRVVERYSGLRLTRESDRLVALIGVATAFQSFLKCGYMAGLWQDDLARGLLWDVRRYYDKRSQRRPHRSREPFTPSWSWASLMLDGESSIVFPVAHDDSFKVDDRFTYLGTNIPPAVTDATHGAPSNDKVSINVAAISAILFQHREGDSQGKKTTLVFDHDCEDAVMINAVGFHLDVPWTTTDLSSVKDGDTVHCLLIGSMEDHDWKSSHRDKYFSTLVVTSSGRIKKAYERIGVLDIRQDSGLFQAAPEVSFTLV